MGKLIFYYGTMNSGKTTSALMTRFQRLEYGQDVILAKPSIDTRDGINITRSRIGFEAEIELIESKDNLLSLFKGREKEKPLTLIIDEAQFLTRVQVSQLRILSTIMVGDIICFGLLTDFQTKLFDGSEMLITLADEHIRLNSICFNCGKSAIFNGRFDENGDMITSGNTVVIGGNEMYRPLCAKCLLEKMISDKIEGGKEK